MTRPAPVAANRVVDECASTNDLARELGEQGAPHGSWISARRQGQGRGRLGRQWQSLEGNLFLSLIARIEDKARWTWVPMTVAVGVARWIEACFPELAPRFRIKWPNDLWIVPDRAPPGAAGAKLGGILCEAVGTRAGSFIVVGLGLNCLSSPHGIDQATTSLSLELGQVTADDVRAEVVAAVMQAIDELAALGPARVVRDYERMAALPPGSRVEWSSQRDGRCETRHAAVRGLGPSGELLVTSIDDGQEIKLLAEDVRVRASSPIASDGSPA